MATDDQVTLILEGERAREGVTLAAFESFVSHFLAALRYHYRATRAAEVRKQGRPLGDEDLATAFRLVAFRKGSGVAVLAPPIAAEESVLTKQLPTTLAWDNLQSLVDTIDTERRLDPSVMSEIQAALKSLGRRANLSVEIVADGISRQYELNEDRLDSLRARWESNPDIDTERTVVGVLHAIDLEPDKVAVRTPSGVDWTCEYSSAWEAEVLSLVGHRVWAHGVGRVTSGRSGVLRIDEIRPLPEAEQTRLFTSEPLPFDLLKTQQGIISPQGITLFIDPDWSDSDESESFLRALLDEDM